MDVALRIEDGEFVCDFGPISSPPPDGSPFTGSDVMLFDQQLVTSSIGVETVWRGYTFSTEEVTVRHPEGATHRVTITHPDGGPWVYRLHPAHWATDEAPERGRPMMVGKRAG